MWKPCRIVLKSQVRPAVTLILPTERICVTLHLCRRSPAATLSACMMFRHVLQCGISETALVCLWPSNRLLSTMCIDE